MGVRKMQYVFFEDWMSLMKIDILGKKIEKIIWK
jgi:hypothetical protein